MQEIKLSGVSTWIRKIKYQSHMNEQVLAMLMYVGHSFILLTTEWCIQVEITIPIRSADLLFMTYDVWTNHTTTKHGFYWWSFKKTIHHHQAPGSLSSINIYSTVCTVRTYSISHLSREQFQSSVWENSRKWTKGNQARQLDREFYQQPSSK